MALAQATKDAIRVGLASNSAANEVITGLEQNDDVVAGTVTASKVPVVGTAKQLDTLALAALTIGTDATAGAALTSRKAIFSKTGIADTVATTFLNFSVPAATHSATAFITLMGYMQGTDVNESVRVATATIAIQKNVGVTGTAAISALGHAQITTEGSGATFTMTSAFTTAVGTTGAQTFPLQVTFTASAGTNTFSVLALVELLNVVTSGVTVAVA